MIPMSVKCNSVVDLVCTLCFEVVDDLLNALEHLTIGQQVFAAYVTPGLMYSSSIACDIFFGLTSR